MATLKISELSVGDWVQDGNGIIAKVRGIENWSNGYILNVQTVSGSICTLSATGALPIPITAEMLEKNGFEFDKASRWHICELEDKTRINVWIGRNNEGRIEVSRKDPFDGEWHFNYADIEVVKITVHQFQHALRLAGVDKEINL